MAVVSGKGLLVYYENCNTALQDEKLSPPFFFPPSGVYQPADNQRVISYSSQIVVIHIFFIQTS
jgi:hypothetical protein